MRATMPTTPFDAPLTFHFAEVFAVLGDTERALDVMAEAIRKGFDPAAFFRTHCRFVEPLRSEARQAVAGVLQGRGESARVSGLSCTREQRDAMNPCAIVVGDAVRLPAAVTTARTLTDNVSLGRSHRESIGPPAPRSPIKRDQCELLIGPSVSRT